LLRTRCRLLGSSSRSGSCRFSLRVRCALLLLLLVLLLLVVQLSL